MEIFVIHNGEQSGPFRVFELRDKISEGSIDVSDAGWYRGLDTWKPLHEIEALRDAIPGLPTAPDDGGDAPDSATSATGDGGEPVVETPTTDDAVERDPVPSPVSGTGEEPEGEPAGQDGGAAPAAFDLALAEAIGSRIWPRFGARMVDNSLFWLLVVIAAMFSGAEFPADVSQRAQTAFVVLTVLAWFLVDAALITSFATTPGKAIAGLWVVDAEGKRLSTGRSLARSLLIFVFGWGFGLPLLMVFSWILSHFRMQQTGTTFWDERTGSRVLGRPVSTLRTGLLVAIPLVVAWISLYLSWDELMVAVEQIEAQKAAQEAENSGVSQ